MKSHTLLVMLIALAAGISQSLFLTHARAQSSPALPLTYYPIDERSEFSTSLSGAWKFSLGPTDANYFEPGYDDRAWKAIQVPGNGEMQGFADPKYRNPDDNHGYYRRTFTVPDAWKGRRTFIRFEGVAFAFEFFVNGKRAGAFASAFNRSEFDITDYVEIGRPATLAVHVSCREKGWEFDTNDDWALSGIHRDVILFSMPETHVKDYTVVTPVSGDGKQASVRVTTWVENFLKKPASATVNLKLLDAQQAVVGSLSKTVALTEAGGVVEADLAVPSPKLWTAETPELYGLSVELISDGQQIHQFSQRIGLRQTTIDGKVFKLNGKAVKFRGVNHHDLHPETGRTMTRQQYIHDLELMKAANINAIRMSHYPPQKMFLDLCDEYGMYVIDEVPFGFGEKNLTNDSYEDVLATRARATVARDKNQTSVLMWTVGNENPYTPMVVRTAGLVKALDPSRSRALAHAWEKYYFQVPPELDIVAPHYLAPRAGANHGLSGAPFLDDLDKHPECTSPVLLTEYAHAAGTGVEVLQKSWEIMQNNEQFIGGCVWEFEDQGLYRTVPTTAYPGLPKLTDTAPVTIGTIKASTWVAADRVIDTSGQEGADGIVDADRKPSSDYFAVRKVYAPVVVGVASLQVKPGRQTLKIPIENRFDFTDLSAVQGGWELIVDGQKSQSGMLAKNLPARAKGTYDLVVDLPEKPESHDQYLRFVFADVKNRPIVEHTIRLNGEAALSTRLGKFASRLESGPASDVSSVSEGPTVTYTTGTTKLIVNRETGDVQFGTAGQPAMAFNAMALRVGRAPQNSEIRAYKDGAKSEFWDPYLLMQPAVKEIKTGNPANGKAAVDLKLQFTRAGTSGGKPAADQGFIADVHLVLSGQGYVDISYELTPVNAQDYLLELGLALRLPSTSARLTWLGNGPYPTYPGQTDSMDRGVYTIAPKSGFDPSNRVYPGNRTEVALATATNDEGSGVGIVCDDATVSLEPVDGAVVLSHLVRVAGHGEKRSISSFNIKAADLKPVSGAMRLVPLVAGKWPEVFKSVLGNPQPAP